MKFKKFTFILFLLIFISFNLSLIIGANETKNNIDNYFRIHIVANSDNLDDQILKLNVYKDVNNYINSLTQNVTDKSELVQILTDNIYSILNIAKKSIADNGYNYSVNGYIGNIKYDEKTKDGNTMPEGIYHSLKLVIGEGNGENWWSLLFPNSIDGLTVDEATSKEDITFSLGFVELFKEFLNSLKTD